MTDTAPTAIAPAPAPASAAAVAVASRLSGALRLAGVVSAALVVAATYAGPAIAQGPAGSPAPAGTVATAAAANAPPAAIMYLGVFHFDYPNLDVQKPVGVIDVLEPDRQREIEELVALLAEFRPTKIAVEFTADRQPRLDSLYAEYRTGRWALGRNEVYQLGFRLAARLGLDGVVAVDTERHDFFVDLARTQLEPRVGELFATDVEQRDRLSRERAREDSAAFACGETLREKLLRGHQPERLRRDHMAYSVGFFKFDGEAGGYTGADFVSGWYNRNLRIFRNLQRITTSPGERILFIVGSGHLPILRFVTAHSPEYELVDATEYLRHR
jgi:hypothetical protein